MSLRVPTPLPTRSTSSAAGKFSSALACALALALGGCGSDDSMDDLQSKVREIKSRPGKRPDPLPPIKAYVNYAYAASEQLDPFKSFLDVEEALRRAADEQVPDTGISPDFDRNREELETFSLDSLRLMGTLEQQGALWAIVRSPDSILHRVQTGNYIGQNYGRITEISTDGIGLTEIVKDERGSWTEREAALTLIQ